MRIGEDDVMLKVAFAAKPGPSAGNRSGGPRAGLPGHVQGREGGLKAGMAGGVARAELHGPVEEHRLGRASAPGPRGASGQVRGRPALENIHRHVNELLG